MFDSRAGYALRENQMQYTRTVTIRMQQVCFLQKTHVVEGNTTTMFGKECWNVCSSKKETPLLFIYNFFRPEGVQRRIMSHFCPHELHSQKKDMPRFFKNPSWTGKEFLFFWGGGLYIWDEFDDNHDWLFPEAREIMYLIAYICLSVYIRAT